MRNCTPSHLPAKVKRAILGGGFGAGLGLIGVALMAAGAMHANRPERLADEVLMLLLGGFAGLALGWLTSPSGMRRSQVAAHPVFIPQYPVAALADNSSDPLPSVTVGSMPSWAPA